MLDGMASQMEGKAPEREAAFENGFERLEQTIRTYGSERRKR